MFVYNRNDFLNIGGYKPRDYQFKMLDNFDKKYNDNNGIFNGKVIQPTGTGKMLQICMMMLYTIKRFKQENKGYPVLNLAVHRGKLIQDNFTKVIKSLIQDVKGIIDSNGNRIGGMTVYVLNSFGKDCVSMTDCFNEMSENESQMLLQETIGVYKDVHNYKADDLFNAVESDRKNGVVLFLSLYQSFTQYHKFDKIKFDASFFDEAHVICSNSTSEINKFDMAKHFIDNSKINVFLTATETNDDTPHSMSNEKIFGDYISYIDYPEMIQKKYITMLEVRACDIVDDNGTPIISIGKLERFNAKDDSVNAENCKKVFDASFIRCVERICRDYEEEGKYAKTLTAIPGTIYIKQIRENSRGIYFDLFKRLNIDIFLTYSNMSNGGGEYRFDANQREGRGDFVKFKNKSEFMKALKDIDKQERHALIINIDQLTTGIDLPCINSLLPFKVYNMDAKSIIQFVGRGLRRDKKDLHLIDDDSVVYNDVNEFFKPSCRLYLPLSCFSIDEVNEYQSILKKMTDGEIVPMLTTGNHGLQTEDKGPIDKNRPIPEELFPNENNASYEKILQNYIINVVFNKTYCGKTKVKEFKEFFGKEREKERNQTSLVTSTIEFYEMIKNNERLHQFVDEKCFMKNTDEFWDFLNRIYSNENKDYRFFHFEA